MPHLMQGEVNDFCEALTKLTKEFGIAIVGSVLVEPLEDYEMSDFDFYAPDESHQKIEWGLHGVKAVEHTRALDSAPPYTAEELDIITDPRRSGALRKPPSQ